MSNQRQKEERETAPTSRVEANRGEVKVRSAGNFMEGANLKGLPVTQKIKGGTPSAPGFKEGPL